MYASEKKTLAACALTVLCLDAGAASSNVTLVCTITSSKSGRTVDWVYDVDYENSTVTFTDASDPIVYTLAAGREANITEKP